MVTNIDFEDVIVRLEDQVFRYWNNNVEDSEIVNYIRGVLTAYVDIINAERNKDSEPVDDESLEEFIKACEESITSD